MPRLRKLMALSACLALAGCSLEAGGLAQGDGGTGMDAARPDAGGRDAGAADAGPSGCTAPADCASGEICCGGECATAGCDDGNPCTNDACGATGCENVPNSDGCDDGIFCNGEDICAGGTCSAHAGNPCPGETLCDEDADTCTGCAGDGDCPGVMRGGWSACAGFGGTCDETGSQERDVTSYRCRAGTCEASVTTESRSCTRSTDGSACGTPVVGDWGPCTNPGAVCAYAGTQERSVDQPICSGGSCSGSAGTTESRSCTRATDGDPCLDGDRCTVGDSCSGGSCTAGSSVTCDDGNPCTTDACDPATGDCTFTPNTRSCDDGDVCSGDQCVDGACVSVCDDGDPCTDDKCHPSMGCQNKPLMVCG